MRIQLFIGAGWAPFDREGNEAVSWPLPNAERLNVPASIEALALLFEKKVRDVYDNAEVEVLPEAAGGGALAAVDMTGDTLETADDALALNAEDLQRGGFDAPAMIAGELEGLLDGIIQNQKPSWQVEL
jgi:hypothetical protein